MNYEFLYTFDIQYMISQNIRVLIYENIKMYIITYFEIKSI